jgi:hypothetical protein
VVERAKARGGGATRLAGRAPAAPPSPPASLPASFEVLVVPPLLVPPQLAELKQPGWQGFMKQPEVCPPKPT